MTAGAAAPAASAPLRMRRRDTAMGARELLIVLPLSFCLYRAVVIALTRGALRLGRKHQFVQPRASERRDRSKMLIGLNCLEGLAGRLYCPAMARNAPIAWHG